MRALALILTLTAACAAQIMQPIVAGSGGAFTLVATTSAPSQTVTINRLTLNGSAILNWGDTQTTAITSGNTGTWTHTYASAGTYTIKLPNSRMIVGLDLRDAKLGALNTAQLRASTISYFYVTVTTASMVKSADMAAWRPTTWALSSMPVGGTYSIASADMAAWRPTYWYLYSMPVGGTYSIASADMAAWRPTTWNLYSMPVGGTYSIASADMAAWRPTIWYLYSMPVGGTYSIASADMAAWRPTYWYLYSMPVGGTYSIASADMAAWSTVQVLYNYSNIGGTYTVSAYTDYVGLVAIRSLKIYSNVLSQASVDAVLKGLWTARASYTYATPDLMINGTNAAPGGTYQSTCPPTTGNEWKYDLINRVCTGSGNPWTIATN